MNHFGQDAIEMSDEEFRLLRDLVYEYCGIHVPHSMKFLFERRLRTRLPILNLKSFRDYYRLLKYAPDTRNEFDQIMERITTNETYFFREDYQLKAFSEEILPQLMEDRSAADPIRIWSAGCSSGEEPYTIAMLIDEHPMSPRYAFDIFGNDISRKVLRIAREGVYRQSSFRQTDESYIRRYFDKYDNGYKLRDTIRNRVIFGHLNLMDEAALSLVSNVDVVFCRNVMIYFSAESRSRLLAILHSKIRPGGYLLLGHSESLVNASSGFELTPLKNDIVYRKPM